MEKSNNRSVKKILWAHEIVNLEKFNSLERKMIENYQKLEEEGFAILESQDNTRKGEINRSVVCSDKTILTPIQINKYFEKRYIKNGTIYSSENREDVETNKARTYYEGFRKFRNR